jgi:hypothetical protein
MQDRVAQPFALAKKAEQGEKEGSAARAGAEAAAPSVQPASPSAGTLGGAFADGNEGRVAAQNAATGSRQRSALAPVQPMASLLAALAGDDTRWVRRAPSGDAVPVDAATRAWLAEVQAATAARWEAPADRAARRDAPAAPASTLRLERDDRRAASVQVEDGGVRFEPPAGGAWFAPLPPDVVARLRASLPPAGR